MYYAYILININKTKTYSGHSANLSRRLAEHNNNNNKSTSNFGLWDILHFEEFNNIKDAIKREKYFKSCAGRKFIKKLFDNYKC